MFMQHKSQSHLYSIERDSSLFWREINPKPQSCLKLKKLLEMYGTYEQWEKVINLSSRAVLHLNKNYERAEFYYIWICALKESFDLDSLVYLGEHLIFMGEKYSPFYCLAALSFHFAGENTRALNLLKMQKRELNTKNRYYRECVGLILATLPAKESNKTKIIKGINHLKKLCLSKNSNYLSWRNCLRVLAQFDCEDSMSDMYNAMGERFSFCHEPYLVSALIAMEEKKWVEAISLLKIILIENPKNSESTLALANCLLETNEVAIAFDFLNENNHLFPTNDYDYNLLMGVILDRLSREKNSIELTDDAIVCYQIVISEAKKFYFPTENIQNNLKDLLQFKKILLSKSALLESLDSFLGAKNPSIGSLLNMDKMDRNLKVSNDS